MKISVNPAVYSAKCSSPTAQSSTKETGLAACFMLIIIFRPDLRISATRPCKPVSTASTTPPCHSLSLSQPKPSSAIISCRRFKRFRFSAPSSSANSTTNKAAGLPRTTSSTMGLKIAMERASSSIVSSISSTAIGSSFTRCWAASMAL